MLTGARAFPGDDLTDTLAAVVRGEPDWTLLPPDLPPTLGVYLRRCLQKDPKQRIPDMATMRLALEGAFETPAAQTTNVRARQSRQPPAWVSAAIVVLSLAVAAVALNSPRIPRLHPTAGRSPTWRNTGRATRSSIFGIQRDPGSAPRQLNVILNWFDRPRAR